MAAFLFFVRGDGFDGLDQLFGIDGFEEVAAGAGSFGHLSFGVVDVGGEDDNGRSRFCGLADRFFCDAAVGTTAAGEAKEQNVRLFTLQYFG